MRTERDKMLSGELYDALDPGLVRDRDRARDLCQALNATRESEKEIRRQIVSQLFGKGGDTVWMQPPFFCDYGTNIELGERVFFNFNSALEWGRHFAGKPAYCRLSGELVFALH